MPSYSELSQMIAKQVNEAMVENADAMEEAIKTGIAPGMRPGEMNSRMIINAMSMTARISIQSTLLILHEAGVIEFEGGLTPDLTLLPGGKTFSPHSETDPSPKG